MATYDFRIDWNNDGDFDDARETVTDRVLSRESVTISYGRDQQRSLSPIGPGQAAFALNNTSRDYSPENTNSPLAGNLLPARPVRIQATHLSTTYTLFRGFLDGFDVLPAKPERSVRVTCLDLLNRFRETAISTDLYKGIRTGEAIGIILDEIGWPAADRDLDLGATVIDWWWEENADAGEALERIVNSEGIPALVAVDANGNFVFRDRHHRYTRTESTTSQATISDTGGEPLFSAPLVYDHGWRDIVNSVNLSVNDRAPAGALANVFETDRTYSLSDGQTLPIKVEASDPFMGAVEPVDGTDFTTRSGTVEITLSRTSGQSATIFVKATGGAAVISSMRLRAYPVAVVSTFQVAAEDAVSISRYGRRSYSQDAPWAGIHDARAIAEVLLGYRAERLPIITFRMVNGNDTRLTQMLSRDLSDRITVVDAETGLNDPFFIERIEHTVTEAGLFHETTFGCEKTPTQVDNVFRFDTTGQGFDDGRFGITGLNDPLTMFRFDTAQGFDDGVFAY